MPRYEAIDWYDVPRYYDMVFAEGTGEEAAFLERIAEEVGRPGRNVLEPACGSGRLLEAMVKRGWSVTGFDLNSRMVAHARRRLSTYRGVRVFEADLADFTVTPRFDLAHCLVSTFKYLLSERDAVAHLKMVARALRPGGIYVLGFHLTDYDAGQRSRERWVATDGTCTVTSNLQIWPANVRRRRERVRTRLTVRDGGVNRRLEWYWEFRTYSMAQVQRTLRSVPAFDHIATYDFGYDRPRPFDGERLDVVLVLRRR